MTGGLERRETNPTPRLSPTGVSGLNGPSASAAPHTLRLPPSLPGSTASTSREGSAWMRLKERVGRQERNREEKAETVRRKEDGERRGGREETVNPKVSRLGTVEGSPLHLHNENRGILGKISSVFETSLLGWLRTFPNPFLCSSPKAPQHRFQSGVSGVNCSPLPSTGCPPLNIPDTNSSNMFHRHNPPRAQAESPLLPAGSRGRTPTLESTLCPARSRDPAGAYLASPSLPFPSCPGSWNWGPATSKVPAGGY